MDGGCVLLQGILQNGKEDIHLYLRGGEEDETQKQTPPDGMQNGWRLCDGISIFFMKDR